MIVFLAALCLTVYPIVSNFINQKYASEIHTSYQTAIQQTDDSALELAKQQAKEYNAAIVPGAADTNAYTQEALTAAAADYGSLLNITGDGIMAYVEVPKIGVLLPVFHGTEADVLERGVGHLLGSSLPVGGDSTHAILTGHSGMASQAMFTDLEQLSQGDVFYIQTLNEVLAYQVTQTNVVLPHDTSLLGITPGRDLCTLITCTPYGINTHRLLVTGERIPYEEAEALVTETLQEEPVKSTWEEKYVMGLAIGLLCVLVLVLTYAFTARIRAKIRSRLRRRKTGGGRYAS